MAARFTHAIQTASQRCLFWIVLANLALSCMGWSLPALPLAFLLPRRLRVPAGQFTAMMWCRYFVWSIQASGLARCDLTALDVLRDEPRLIIAPNHPGLLDALLVISRLPHVTCIAKASLWNNFFLGAGIRLAGYIRNDSTKQLLRESARALTRPVPGQMLIFPEGTRSRDGNLLPFKDGAFRLAIEMGAPILPRVVAGTRQAMAKGSFRFQRAHARVRVLEPIETAGLTIDDLPSLRERTRTLIADARVLLLRELDR